MRATIVVGLAVLLAVPLLAGDAAIDELVIEAKDHVHDYSLTPPDSIGGVIEKALSGVSTAQQLYAIVRARFGLKEETARLITIATLRRLMADGAEAQTQEQAEKSLDDLDADYADALRSDASNAAAAREYLSLLADVDNFLPDAARRTREVLRGLPRDQRGLVALEVMSDLRVRLADTVLFDTVTESYGFDPLALAIVGDELVGSNSAEIFDRAAALWLAQKDVESGAAAASRAIYAYGNRRSLADVMRIYRSLPPQAKVIVSRAPASEATVRSRGVERRIGTRDIRFTLAAALILGGDARAARLLLPGGQLKKEDAAVAAILLAAVDAPGGDAFDLVTEYLQTRNPQTTALVDEVFDLVATRAGYAAASKWRLDSVARADEKLGEMERLLLPSAVVALVPMPALRPEHKETISPLLNCAPLIAFVERPVNDGARSSPSEDDSSPIVRPLPSGFDFLRMESRGDEVVAVAASQALDPAGEMSQGGYWIVRSNDRGATWNRPLYTGLRIGQPYEIVIGSTLPMLLDDGVRIEVAANEVDEPITFPPPPVRRREGIALDLKWRDLERDSDHDGLTDLMEERILTDPNSADTDGDGLPDGIDPLPRVKFRQSSDDTPQIVAAAIEAYYATIAAPFGSEHEIDRPTVFIAGDPSDFAAVRSRLRIIVMTDAEIAAASKKFGPTTATRMSPVIIDQTGTRAWVQLTDDGHGTTYLLTKRNGIWTALAVAAWIS